MIVLVSPSYFFQERTLYSKTPNCVVYPLLFHWKDLNAEQIKHFMRIEECESMPLYMSAILDLLRKNQKMQRRPTFEEFKNEVDVLKLSRDQNSPLYQRLRLVESFLKEAPENRHLKNYSVLSGILQMAECPLLVVDLTDPMMSAADANGIFQILFTEFVRSPIPCGKLAVFDEAHKYLQASSSGAKQDPLTASIVSAVRQMRHHGLRLAISTQSPKVLPSELLELVSIAFIHRFHSRDWFAYLMTKLPLTQDCFAKIMGMKESGRALVFTMRWGASLYKSNGEYIREMQVRKRITADGGSSKVNI